MQQSSRYGEDVGVTPVAKAPLPEPPCYLSREECVADVEQFPLAPLFNITGSLLHAAIKAKSKPPASAETPTVHGEHNADGDLICAPSSAFFSKYVHLMDNEQLQTHTKAQSASVVWRDARKLRITASSAKKVPVRSSTDPTNVMREHIYPSFRGNWATEHGKAAEAKAIDTLQSLGISCSARGTVVSIENPWVSASPDGVTSDDTLIEIKCPVNMDCSSLHGKGPCDVLFHDGIPQLDKKGPRGYYLQVQLTMYCTGLKKCLFFVWTEGNHLLVSVPYDEEYVLMQVSRLKLFYYNVMLPRLSDDFNEGRLKLCRQHRIIMSESQSN